jgi:putative ABC transport system permease protein
LLCGLIPAWRIWRTDLHEGLKQGGEHTTSGHSGGWLRSGLVVVQVSLALVLLIGAGLTLRSIYHQLHPGLLVDPRKVLVIDTDLPRQRYPGDQQRTAFFEQLIARLGAWPTVEAVAAASFTPFSGYGRGPIVLEDRPEGPDAPLRWTGSTSVSPEYFRTIGVPLLRGRDLTAQDRKGAPDVALVNETMATRYWPGEDPIGKLFAGGSGTNHGPWITVVGVVRDLRPSGIESDRDPEYYRPWLQAPSTRALVVRTSVNPGNLTPQVQALVREMDKALPAPKVGTLDNMLDNAAANTRVLGTLLSLFGVLALVLAVVGIYGVIAYTVTQRTHEFGVRMALGAQKAQVVFLVLRWGGRMALAGTVLGLVLAWICTRLMVGLVPGVSPRDMTTFLTVPWLLLAAALFGCYLPAHRASRVDPISALRNE